MEFAPVGHIILYGQTYSGKTYYAKHLIEKLNATKVFVFTATPNEWESETVYTDNFETNVQKIKDECTQALKDTPSTDKTCRFIVVFDDFNDSINTITNDVYKELFTRSRHYGVRIINLAHTTKAIGPTARTNSRYICYMSTLSDPELKIVATQYYDNNHMKLKKITDEARENNKYNVILIDRNNREAYTDKAPIKVTIAVELPEESSLHQDPSGTAYQGIASPSMGTGMQTNIGNKSAYNMVDNSQNHFQINHNIKMSQLVQQNNVQNTLKYENYIAAERLDKIKESDECRRLIRSQFKTNADKKRILHDINKRMNPNIPYTIMDYDEGVQDYMLTIHKQKIAKPSSNNRLLSSAIDTYSAEDPISGLTSGYELFNTTMRYLTKY